MTLPSRRRFLRDLSFGAAAVTAAPMINLGRYELFGAGQEYSDRCVELVGRSLVIDMLSPLNLNIPYLVQQLQDPSLFTEEQWMRFRDSGIDVFHIGVGIGGSDAFATCLQWFGAWNSFIVDLPDWFMRIDSVADLEKVHGSGRVGVLLGLQDSDHFRAPDDVTLFHSLGQRVSQLTYNSRNRIGNGSTERVDGGVSDFGVSIIERMNQVGMVVDVSHSGDQTTLDACELSSKPVLFTHSNARVLTPGHPRCKTDEAIRAMAATGGVMGVTTVRNFVSDREPTTIESYLDHFDHIRDLIGPEHLGIGSDIDLDGYDDLPEEIYTQLKSGYKDSYAFRDKIDIEGVDHPKRMFDTTEGLIRRGYTDADIEGILGGNFSRVLGEIWAGEPTAE